MGEILPESGLGDQWLLKVSAKFLPCVFAQGPTVAEVFADTLNRVDGLWFTDLSRSMERLGR
jgi:hypothetical protein